ncbi:MAG TPA: VIT domain-containing protein [Kofleriaceae bacterium]|nr:VIT domain-containing protein [Kofleriaceae bacterium]
MSQALDLMTRDELERLPRDADAGFGSLATARGHLPLEAMDVHARAVGLDVRVELRQTFVNNLAQPIEATYIFPLPDRAAVNRFRLRVGERVVEGVIQERGRARADYDDAIRAGHRAAIAEEERPDVFTVRVGNLMPGQRAEVQIDLVGALAVERNEATFRFPLVVAPRYIPGAPLSGESVGEGAASDTDAVPDASRITPPVLLAGYPNPVRLRLRVDVDPAGLPISRLRSSLHAVVESGGEGGRRAIELARAERLDRDFVLRYALGDGAVRTSLLLARDAEGDAHSFALTLLPPEQGAAGERPRDVVLVLDRSGSMGGWKMVAARRAAARMVDSLCESDRFAVLAFDDVIDAPATLPSDALVAAADRNRFRAVEFLAGLESRGGTEMAAPLLRAAELLGGGYRDRERILVLVTDGQIGNEDQILRELAPRLRGARVFALGVDRAVNAGFLRRLADLGGGGAELVESEDRLDEVMDRVHRRIGSPVVTELSLEGDGLEIEPGSITPRRLPDLMAGAPVVIRGRVRGRGGAGAVVLRGMDRAGGAWQERVAGQGGGGSECAALWARAMIRDLEDRYAIGGADAGALAGRIVDLSVRFSVLSRFTAFLAVDRSEVVNPGGVQHRSVQPVEPASGWDMLCQEGGAGAPDLDRELASGFAGGPPAPPPPMHGAVRATLARAAGALDMRASGAFHRPPSGPVMPGPAQPKPRRERKKEDRSPGRQLLDHVRKQAAELLAPEPAPAAEAAAPRHDLVRRLRELADRVAARASLHPAIVADAVLRDLDAMAGELAATVHGEPVARLERSRQALRALLAGSAGAIEIERALAETEAALRALVSDLEAAGPPSGGRRRDFWK